jgi:ParB-like chromosome segregation protein Spo0J
MAQRPNTLDLHPLVKLFPEMTEVEYVQLKEDIRQNEVRLPVVLLDGKILDGRHRARACRELGIEYPTVEATGDPAAIVAGLNLHRRHLAPRSPPRRSRWGRFPGWASSPTCARRRP